MHELAEANGCRITVAGNADAEQRPIAQQRAGCERGHSAVHSVEAVRESQKIRGGLRRAADAGKLGHAPGLNAQLIEAFDNPFGNGVVAASSAQGGLRAFVTYYLQTNTIDLLGRRRNGGTHLPSLPDFFCLWTLSVTV